jgi:phosphatidylcholine synthase
MTAWLVHVYTASSAVFGFLALTRIFYDRYRDAFFWLALAVVVDATDGVLARRTDVTVRLPQFNGAKLDDIVDYITYVFVPAFFMWHALLVPERWALPMSAAILLSSAYGFNLESAKTADHFFTGFPSYWNIAVFYLFVAGWSPQVNLLILLVLSAFVFVPIRYVYPSRTPVLRRSTIALGVLWGALMVVMLSQVPNVSRTVFWISLVFPLYYVLLSFALEMQRRGPRSKVEE